MAFSKSCKYAKGKVYNFFLGNLWSLFGPLWTPKKVHFGVLNRSPSMSATDKSEPNTRDICQCTQKSKRFVSTGRAQVCSRRDEMHTFLGELKDVFSGLQVFLLFRDRVIFGVYEDAKKFELPFLVSFWIQNGPPKGSILGTCQRTFFQLLFLMILGSSWTRFWGPPQRQKWAFR